MPVVIATSDTTPSLFSSLDIDDPVIARSATTPNPFSSLDCDEATSISISAL